MPVQATPSLTAQISPWLTLLFYYLGYYLVLPFYFRRISIIGQEHLPITGPLLIAPTHRSRWDGAVVAYAAGRWVTKRDLRFMVSADEMRGLQGWAIRHFGGFPVDTQQPAIASLRHGIELLQAGKPLVIFPEGNIFRDRQIHPLKPGLARLAIQAEASMSGLGIKIVPMFLEYGQPIPRWRSDIRICIGAPITVTPYCSGSTKKAAQKLTQDLEAALKQLASDRPSWTCISHRKKG